MNKYKYIIIGGGMTADAAVSGIREIDKSGSILMISAEPDLPYNRPPLSKGLWKGKPLNSIWRNTNERNIEIILSRTVDVINPAEKTIQDENGEVYEYEKLLLATGGKKRKIPFSDVDIQYFRTLEDYKKLRELTEQKQKFGVIGAGFIGSEISAALAMANKDVVIFDIGAGVGWNIFPPGLMAFLNDYFEKKNIQIIPHEKVKSIERKNDHFIITNAADFQAEVDAVVAGVGIEPEVALAEAINLRIDNGIVVNEFLQTSESEIFAAGDVANFFNPLLGKRIRMEHADNANAMGKKAGRNMAGAEECFDYLPFFYSDLFDLGYEAVGLLDSRLEIVEDWTEKYQKGVLYYKKDNRVCGVLLWNVWDKVDDARKIIGLSTPIKNSNLIGRIS